MAKAPTTRDRFRIICEIEVEQLGSIVVQLTKMGLQNIQHELITDVASFARNRVRDIKGEDFARQWLEDHPTFKALELVEHFRADNRTDGAAYTALRMLTEQKEIKKLSPGQYSRADVKAIAPPKKAKAAKGAKKAKGKRSEVSNADYLLRVASRAHGRFTSETMKKHFASDKRPPTGVGPTISQLMRLKKLRRISEGLYEVINKPKPNGPLPVTPVDHATELLNS